MFEHNLFYDWVQVFLGLKNCYENIMNLTCIISSCYQTYANVILTCLKVFCLFTRKNCICEIEVTGLAS